MTLPDRIEQMTGRQLKEAARLGLVELLCDESEIADDASFPISIGRVPTLEQTAEAIKQAALRAREG